MKITTMKLFPRVINFLPLLFMVGTNEVFSQLVSIATSNVGTSNVAGDSSCSNGSNQPVNSGEPPKKSCPANLQTCGRPSGLANLICYADQNKNGFNYAFLTFGGDGILAFVSINLDCQPGVVSILDVLIIYGFVFRLTYPTKCGKREEKLWYLNLSVKGCPSIQELVNYAYNNMNGQFNEALYPAPIGDNVVYQVYGQMMSNNYNAQCNNFRVESVSGSYGNCPTTCSTRTSPTTRIVLDQIKTANVYNAQNNGSTIKYIRDYGICGLSCTPYKEPLPGIEPPVYQELCTSDGYAGIPYCRNFQKAATLDEIAQSYDYDQYLENLDVYEVCELATLWAQGYNCNSKNNNGSSNCPENPGGGTTTFCRIAIIPQADQFINYRTPAYPDSFIFYIILEGYCSIRTQQDIMQYFVTAC